jgi:hypothetical protein
VTSTGTSSTNVAGYFSASGATNNYGLLVPNGSVGIGTTSPSYTLDVTGVIHTSNNLVVGSTAYGQSGFYVRAAGRTSAATPSYTFNDGSETTGLYEPAANVIGFTTSGAETARIDASGNVGIGTTSPGALLDVHGHIGDSGATASVGTCGTSPAITGNDTRGVVTLGTGSPTACTVTFNSAYTTAPYCVITPYGGLPGAIQWYITTSTTTLVMNFSASPTASQQFQYHCMQ